jgi:uncharacterized protein (DUF58 family)
MPNTADIIARVRRVELRTSKLANDLMVGAYYSQFKGRGMDFEELREYVPGDDVRTIDWNVTAKLRKPFVKLHREERELAVMLVLDVSASGDFGSLGMSKRDFAAEIAATLAFSALRNGDKVGMLLFTDEVELYLPPKKGRRHLLRVIREALSYVPRKRGTNIQGALAFLLHVMKRRAIVFLLTDFLHTTGVQGRDLFSEIGATNARHDLICLHLTDPRERVLPPAGLLTLEDAETGEEFEIDTMRESTRRNYAKASAERLEHLDRALGQTRVDVLRLSPSESYANTLQRFFEGRRRR